MGWYKVLVETLICHTLMSSETPSVQATPPEGKSTFEERYFVCDKHCHADGGQKGPIFFYVGNEADVTL